MSNKQTFAERCQTAERCLPDTPYRDMLTKLHAEMLMALSEQPRGEATLAPLQQEKNT